MMRDDPFDASLPGSRGRRCRNERKNDRNPPDRH
jgi:hypothetical protein